VPSLAALKTWVGIIWWVIRVNTRGIWLVEIVVGMDLLIDNPLTLSIVSKGFYRYILSLLLLEMTILLPSRNGNIDNLIITSSSADGQHSLKFGVETTYKLLTVVNNHYKPSIWSEHQL